MIYRIPSFLAVVWFGSTPAPSPLFRQQIVSFSVFLCVAGPAYWREGGEGAGVEPNHTTSRKLLASMNHSILSALLYRSSSPLSSPFLPSLRLFVLFLSYYFVYNAITIFPGNLDSPEMLCCYRYCYTVLYVLYLQKTEIYMWISILSKSVNTV